MEPIVTHIPHSAREARTITSCHVWINHSFSHTLATQSHLWGIKPKEHFVFNRKKERNVWIIEAL